MNKTVVSLALLLTLLISDKKLIPILSQQQDDQTAECLFGDSSPPRLQQRCASNTPSGSNLFGSPAFLSAPAVPAPAAGGGMKGSQSLIPVVQLGLPTFQQLFRTPALPQPAAAALSLAIPPLESCKIGQRFIANHIVYICHQYRTDLRGFRPFGWLEFLRWFEQNIEPKYRKIVTEGPKSLLELKENLKLSALLG
jgi:hypothetical protein